MLADRIILALSIVAALVILSVVAVKTDILKRIQPQTNQTTSSSSATIETSGPKSGTYNFKGKLTKVTAVSTGTEITLEWRVTSDRTETRTLVVTPVTKVTIGLQSPGAPSSADKLLVGDEVVVEATLEASTVTWTVNSVQILK